MRKCCSFFTLSIFRTLLWQPVGKSFFARINENMELEVYLSIRKLPGKADSFCLSVLTLEFQSIFSCKSLCITIPRSHLCLSCCNEVESSPYLHFNSFLLRRERNIYLYSDEED